MKKKKTYRVSGYIEGEPYQVDIIARTKEKAKEIAKEKYDYDFIVAVTRI